MEELHHEIETLGRPSCGEDGRSRGNDQKRDHPDRLGKRKTAGCGSDCGGARRRKDGKMIPMSVKVGDRVITSKYSGTEIKIDETEYIIVSQNDILAVVE